MAAAGLLLAACVGSSPTAAPSLAPVSPTVAPTVLSTPSGAPNQTPAVDPTATANQVGETPPPSSPVDLLISYAHPDLQASCRVSDQIYDEEVASITCGPEDLPFDYSLFPSLELMNDEYRSDVRGAETPPEPDGTCPEGNYEDEYERVGARTGRVNCREHVSDAGDLFHVIEWTHEGLLVIGYISNRPHTWDELITFWEDQAGPFPPD